MNDTATKLDSFTSAYIECALWSSTDNSNDQGGEPLDENYVPEDLAPECLAKMVEDCANFQADEKRPLELCGLDSEQAGHDFWLTRNHHGAGFWDRKHRGVLADKALDRLTQASHEFGSFDLYVGDDGRIYGN